MLSAVPTKFGDLTRDHRALMSDVPSRIARACRGVTVPGPMDPRSDAMRKELLATLRHIASPSLDEQTMCEIDQDMIPHIIAAAEESGCDYDEEEIRGIVADLVPAIMRMKYRFNMPRPWQVAPAYGLSLLRLQSDSAETPSYPSGHAIQAAVACGVLSARNPFAARALDQAAEEIGESRLALGLHFPIDVLVGLRVGRQIADNITVPRLAP